MVAGRRRVVLAVLVAALALPCGALAAFPGSNPAESPRANTPNDPDFDPCEEDDPDTSPPRCTSYWSEEFRLFGFSPDSANQVPDPLGILPRSVTATRYADCSQLDQAGRSANLAAGDPQCAQIAGVRADTAWKYSIGSPKVVVAILDTGIRWQAPELVNKVHLNKRELPLPRRAGGSDCASYDCNGDGAFDVRDYAADPRVAEDAGDDTSDHGDNADAILDASDLIARFSNGSDAEGNGYADDIAGWDFFDDDNDPYDASSCCSANGHGTGRATEALAETNNGIDGAGLCPKCQLMPLRVWDTFVVPTDNYAMGVVYAAENGASVVEGAVGGLANSQFARQAFRYADRKGVALTLVSSDINSANHNYPTNYNEAIYVAGSLPDSAPLETCSGPGGLPGFGDIVDPPAEFEQGCQQLLGLLGQIGVTPTAQPITTSFFRNANVTQYGGKSDIVLSGATGSENTGQAAGAAGLLASYGRQSFGADDPLSGNEIRQLLTMTAEDVLPANSGTIGFPDKARAGWDPHFGYGRVNLAAAMKRIADGRVPPEARIDAPDWFTPIDVERVPGAGVPIMGHAAAPHSDAGVGSWTVEYACGQDAPDSAFAPIPGASGSGPVDGPLGTIPKSLLTSLASSCDGSVRNDAGRPAGALTDPWPADPYPSPDPERHAFQIRLTVREVGDAANFGRYRKTLFAYHDDGNLPGWPRPLGSGSSRATYATGSGGEVPPRLYDLDGDNELDVLLPTSSGELFARHADGSPLAAFNGGDPVRTRRYRSERKHPVPGALPTPHEALRAPAIGDIDGDREAEIVATGGEHLYAWELDGSRVEGFPVGVDRSLSDPCVPGAPHPCLDVEDRAITSENHIKRGFMGSPVLADLDRDGRLDVVAGALDQHVYAWNGNGDELPGYPVKLVSEGADGAEIITTPAIAQLDGDGPPEVIIATNEVVPGAQTPGTIFDLFNALAGSVGGSNPVYAIHGDGTPVEGWPVDVGVLAGDLLPLVLPGHDAAALDEDGDGNDEAVISAGTSLSLGGNRLIDGDGSTIRAFNSAAGNTIDQGPIVNVADYPVIGDVLGTGDPQVFQGGLTLNGGANLLAPNQNLPFSHVEQGWDAATGLAVPGYPRATDDYQFVTQGAIAKVAPGPGRQILVPTGLYQLHAYGPGGVEAPGWPKFTGGWLATTPAVGDADGDGELDVVAVTREGWSFLWGTDVPTCGGSNDEWWTFHHDERSTANYGTDARPPGSVSDLEATRDRGDGSVEVSWAQPGDDWLCGQPARFEVRVSRDRIRHPDDGRMIAAADASGGVGSSVSRTFGEARIGRARHVAVLYRDEAGNWGLLRRARIPGGPPPSSEECTRKLNGTAGADRILGSPGSDRIHARQGPDRVRARGGDDCIRAGRGRDKIRAGSGDDRVRALRGGFDVVRCGAGDDSVVADPRDLLRGCEELEIGP